MRGIVKGLVALGAAVIALVFASMAKQGNTALLMAPVESRSTAIGVCSPQAMSCNELATCSWLPCADSPAGKVSKP